MKMKNAGMFWHVHHNKLVEYCYDYKKRVAYIKNNKPPNEVSLRLKLFKPVKGKLPAKFTEACKACDEVNKVYGEARKAYHVACKAYCEAYNAYCETRKACDEANKAYCEAYNACNEACKAYELDLIKLHAKEGGCKEWNGEEVIFLKGE